MNVLITGKNSYIGNAIAGITSNKKINYTKISLRDNLLNEYSFQNYHTVIHVAGIAHVNDKSIEDQMYFKVNRDLAIETAKKAKSEGVKQFIFMSSVIIFGPDKPIGDWTMVDTEHPQPNNAYAKSKLEADLAIQALHSDDFKVAIIRTPMVYGAHSKGNFGKLVKLAKLSPVYPKIDNNRSAVYIRNFCALIQHIIENQDYGMFYPQDKEYLNTNQLILYVRTTLQKKTLFLPGFGRIIKRLSLILSPINKIYGNKAIPQTLSNHYEGQYQICDRKTAVQEIIKEESK